MIVFGGLDIRWIRGLGAEKLPAASYALLPNLKRVYFLPSERDRDFCRRFSTQQCLYQTLRRRPPRITGRFMNTVTRGWVGAPNERAPFKFHGAVVDFVDRCLSKTAISLLLINYLAEFFSGRSWPNICPGIICYFFEILELIVENLCS